MGVDRRGREGERAREERRGLEKKKRGVECPKRLSIFDKFDDAGKGEISVWAKLLANWPFLVGENT